ncbi:MAG: ATP-binding protein, partial [Eggerthellaceae bacterium]|nr:ATP-binding protein [Eggerthellaceae bacterium]
MMHIDRPTYLTELIERKNNGLVKVITGIRRSGKSYLLNTIFAEHLRDAGVPEDHIIAFAFDSADDLARIGENLLELTRAGRKVDPEKFLAYMRERISGGGRYYLLLDEIQLLGAFETVLNGYLRDPNLDIYVTGSNSKFLSSDIATEFRGRGDIIRVHPLRFSEFAGVYGDRLEAWDDYLTYGGMPMVLSYSSPEGKTAYLDSLFELTYIRDIVDRNAIGNGERFGELLDVVASSVGSLINPTKLENTFRSVRDVTFPHATIERYLGFCEEAFLLERVKRFDVKGKRYIGTPYKVYFEDVGLRNSRLNFRQTEKNHLMENVLYNDLRARRLNVDVGTVETFSKDAAGKTIRKTLEVDFVVNRSSERFYIQSAY